jgi:hypothetical protein
MSHCKYHISQVNKVKGSAAEIRLEHLSTHNTYYSLKLSSFERAETYYCLYYIHVMTQLLTDIINYTCQIIGSQHETNI